MTTSTIAEKWKQALSKAREAWADLTDAELEKAEAGLEHLIDLVQEKYGKTKEDASKLVHDFWNKHNPDKKD